MAGVNERQRVYGIKGPTVAAASIMPTLTSRNTNAPSIMIGYKATDMLQADAAWVALREREPKCR